MNISMRKLDPEEQRDVLPLLGICFPLHWKKVAETCSEMPFEEISFGAYDGEKLVGHCGLVPHDIYMDGAWYPVAGVASVAVSPTHQKMGIAKKLCDFAACWAENNRFNLLPLYTEFFRVYEVSGWKNFPIPDTVERVKKDSIVPSQIWKKGSELSEAEKQLVIKLYKNGENFNGKLRRLMQGKLQSWDRMFSGNNLFALRDNMYAAQTDGVLAEIYFAECVSDVEKTAFFNALGNLPCYLPPTASSRMIMSGIQWRTSAVDAMHGERPMVRLPEKSNPVTMGLNGIFFSLLDKF